MSIKGSIRDSVSTIRNKSGLQSIFPEITKLTMHLQFLLYTLIRR
jgi:hypothetical protein